MANARKTSSSRWIGLFIVGVISLILLIFAIAALNRASIPVLQPAGPVAADQKELLITAFLLMLIVVVPVFILLGLISWRYRESNKKATYLPNWDSNRLFEFTWWVIPGILIAVLALLTWRGTMALDPYKPLATAEDSIKIQVVALDWRWLFIYPDYNVASLNELYLPVNTSVQFDITADAPMNSFWIPQLGGQVYAMPGMGTRLHLMADRTGSYYGSSANISGEGFASMNFQAVAMPQSDFDTWVDAASKQEPLSDAKYAELAKASSDKTVRSYSQPATGLYSGIIGKYMFGNHAQPSQKGSH